MKNNFKKAFSLIEISMVILIVGILIAGISKGLDLVNDMRIATARALTDKAPMFGMENLEMWLETTSENSLATGTASFTNVKNPSDKQPIGRWNDINPTLIDPNYKNHAVQGNINFQPLYVQDGINGLPALLFDGFDDSLDATNGKTNFSEFTIFLILNPKFKSNTIGYSNVINISCSGNVIACRKLSSSTGYSTNYQGGNPTVWIWITFNSTTFNPTFTYTQSNERAAYGDVMSLSYSVPFTKDIPRIAEVNHGNNQVKVFISSQPITTSTNHLPLLTGPSYLDFRIGTQKFNGDLSGFNNRNYKGLIGEIILFGRSLNDQETLLIKNYLSEKWRIKL